LDSLLNLEAKDWLVVCATLLGPILAVQAQKAIENIRYRKQRKMALFEQLMATRAARLSAEHVGALNMIDLIFYGKIIFGKTVRSNTEQKVLNAWKEYHDHLGTHVADNQLVLWNSNSDDLFIQLLSEIALDLNLSFDRVLLKRGSYSPMAHSNLEHEQMRIRQSVLDVLEGKKPLHMNIDGFKLK
jgi:uncharacterized protein YbaA (DUF1428 family)